MAEDQGQRRDLVQSAPWLKLFGAFKVALDPKKLLLAGAGILVMAFGWWVLAIVFGFFRSTAPEWKDYDPPAEKAAEKKEEAYKEFKAARRSWNLFHEMAGTTDPTAPLRKDAADLADTLAEYRQLTEGVQALRRFKLPVKIHVTEDEKFLEIEGKKFPFTVKEKEKDAEGKVSEKYKETLDKLNAARVEIGDLKGKVDLKQNQLTIGDVTVGLSKAKAEELQKSVEGARSPEELQREGMANAAKRDVNAKILKLYKKTTEVKPYGRLRTWPWFEYRGPNPYLLVTGNVKVSGPEGTRATPWRSGQFFDWLLTEQLPVLLEPLVKFLDPVKFLFDPAAGGWNRIYLFLVIVWTLLTWALFGGAITRMAAVQVARHNEKISMVEALRFARGRFQAFFSAPLFPLIFLAVITLFLIIYGLFEGFTFFFGDIFIAGLMWPLILIAGLVMAVVLVGLVGWPLMYSTISTEGSDSFDALSRSYSYVYQAPWHYIWYSLVALVYGAVLVFFVGFMGSLLVYMGKWGVTQAPYLASREPSYLFNYAPTSFGWRDLLLHKSPQVQTRQVIRPNGSVGESYDFSEKYAETISWSNRIGAFMVSVWLYLLFLLVVGFGYSYFWTAATIIYLLMRRKVDDTEMDEIHLEEEEDSFAPETAAPPAPVAKPEPGPVMVDAPTLRAPGGDTPATPPSPEAPPPS
jgi:hypothetical protein